MTLRTRRFLSFLTTATLVLSAGVICRADMIFVDNRTGDDGFDGRVSAPGGGKTGPVRSITRALQIVRTGDSVQIRDTGTPYFESIVLFGARHSGLPSAKFTIDGNGTVVDGSMPVPFDAWKHVNEGLWKFTPFHKGYYQLIKNDVVLPEVAVESDSYAVPKLERGQWCAWRGSIYYQSPAAEHPPMQKFRFAVLGMGMTLYRIHDAEIRDLTFRHFRIDGVNAPDLCQSVKLENVASTNNGRSGLFVGGGADIVATGSHFDANREHQLLTRGKGHIELDQSETREQPVKVE